MRYTTDLTDHEWSLIAYCFPRPAKTGRPREHAYRDLLNAIFYVVRTGCQWRNLPKDLPLMLWCFIPNGDDAIT